jgi:L-threonylcarbamoyladenylate synthase
MTLTEADIQQAVALLKAGEVIGLPTETVYGLAGDASNPEAIARIYAMKNRPSHNPLIVHLPSADALPQWACDIPEAAYLVARAFWPGPLTLILKKQPWVLDDVTGGQPTVGLRVPAHPVALAVLKAFGGGLAAPSANLFTEVSPTTAKAVREALGDRLGLVLDGGGCEVGLESTILDLSGDQPRILRPGMLSRAAIEAVLGVPVLNASVKTGVRVPGQSLVHYAPHTPVEWVYPPHWPSHDVSVALIAHTKAIAVPDKVRVCYLSSDPEGYAKQLYSALRELDKAGLAAIWIEHLPETAAWEAIRDRLNKAASR